MADLPKCGASQKRPECEPCKEEQLIEWVKRGVVKHFTAEFMEQRQVEIFRLIDEWTGELAIKIRERIPAKTVYSETVHFRLDVPATWWEMFKRDVLRRPCRTKPIRQDRVVRLRAVMPDLFKHVKCSPEDVGLYFTSFQVGDNED